MATQQQQEDENHASSRLTVLIVDDEQPILELLQEAFEDAGYRVFTAHDGHVAFALARQYIPDLVLTDLMMPRMKGHELWAQLHRDVDTSRIPVIGMSAALHDVADEAFAALLAKPFDLDQVLRRADEVLSHI